MTNSLPHSVKPPSKDLVSTSSWMLTADQLHRLADVPAVLEWLANAANARTRRAYKMHVEDFASFVRVKHPEEFRAATRAHVTAWCDELKRRQVEMEANERATLQCRRCDM